MSEAFSHPAPPVATAAAGRKILFALAALFVLPIVVASALLAGGWRPGAGVAHGELFVAPEPLPFDGLRHLDGTLFAGDVLAGKWTLLVVAPNGCSAECQARIESVRRVHVALNKKMPRVRRALLSAAPASDPQLPALRARQPDLVIAAPASPAWQALLAQSGVSLIVIDPAGRTVLRYRDSFDAKGALQDMVRLLRYSWLG